MRVVIATETPTPRDDLRQAALGIGLECDTADCVPYSELAVRLARGVADLVIVVVGVDPTSAVNVIQRTSSYNHVPVLAVGKSHDPQFILQVMRAGAREYIDSARAQEELAHALHKMSQSGAVNYRLGQMLAVTAATPGSGVTTVASSLAFALGDKYPQRVALAEIGGGVPELALALDLDPRHSVADLAQNWERLDTTMMRQTIVEHPAGVNVLAYKPETLLTTPLGQQAMRQTLLLLKAMYEISVLDLGCQPDGPGQQALTLADAVVLVIRLDVPSLRLARKYVYQLGERGVLPEKLRLVANRYGQRKQVAWKQAEDALGLPILAGIPDDPSTLNQALNSGTPLIRTSRRAGITRSFDRLAGSLNGRSR
jgi:pilus assembly protein CpaE